MFEFFLFQTTSEAPVVHKKTVLPPVTLEKKAASILSASIAFQQNVAPLNEEGNLLTCASCSDSLELRQLLSFHCGKSVRLIQVSRSQLQQLLYSLYSPDDQSLYGLLRAIPEEASYRDTPNETILSRTPEGRFLISLVDYSLAQSISDIHLLPHRDGIFVKVRRDGQFLEHPEPILSPSSYRRLLQQLKVSAAIPLYAKTQPCSGSIHYAAYNEERLLRLSILPAPHAASVVIRLPARSSQVELHQLSFPPEVIYYLQEYLKYRRGMLLICGPTGSGKTTLLYALIKEASKQQVHTITVEDPVEVLLPGVCQTECDRDDMAEFCIAALRHDPDILVPGEIRDAKTAAIAFDAALSGHAVMATLHAGCSRDAQERLNQLGISKSCSTQALSCIVSIQLIPRLCQNCALIHETASHLCGTTLFQRSACKECHYTGYKGQLPLIEIDERLHLMHNTEQDSLFPSGSEQKSYNAKTYLEKLLYAGTIDIDTYIRFQGLHNDTATQTERMPTYSE